MRDLLSTVAPKVVAAGLPARNYYSVTMRSLTTLAENGELLQEQFAEVAAKVPSALRGPYRTKRPPQQTGSVLELRFQERKVLIHVLCLAHVH